MHRINDRSKGKVIDFVPSAEFERGSVLIAGVEYPAIKFRSGIVHVIKHRRGQRVSKAIARTFVKGVTNNG